VFFVTKAVLRTILLPTGLGMLIHHWAPGFAATASALLGRIGNGLLVVAVVPLLIVAWRPAISLIRQGDILAMIAFTAFGLAAGHWLGGPDPAERRSLALATALHHPGLAIAIAAANFPTERLLVAAAVVIYLLISTLVLIPYNAWCKRRMVTEGIRSEHRTA
jgi:bile acid:Na+ symporter, BASS family